MRHGRPPVTAEILEQEQQGTGVIVSVSLPQAWHDRLLGLDPGDVRPFIVEAVRDWLLGRDDLRAPDGEAA